jgi:hypothetical protein
MAYLALSRRRMLLSGFGQLGQLDELLPPIALRVARQPPDIRIANVPGPRIAARKAAPAVANATPPRRGAWNYATLRN